jgi:hypothetical protein
MPGHESFFKLTSKNGIFSIYAIIVQRIPLKPRVRIIEGKLKKALTFLYEIILQFLLRAFTGLHMATLKDGQKRTNLISLGSVLKTDTKTSNSYQN